MKKIVAAFIFALTASGLSQVQAGEPAGRLNVEVDRSVAKTGPLFYGLMTEEINHAYDGGLYAELIQNRIFRDDAKTPAHWSAVGDCGIALDAADPVNDGALRTSLRMSLGGASAARPGGVANDGFWGIPVWPNTTYHASFYARAGDGFAGPLKLTIESVDGKTVYAAGTVDSVSAAWKKFSVDLSTGSVAKTADARFVLTTEAKGTVWLSLVSLFPPTYHNRANGNRIDLMEKLAAMHPAFLRFPGGNYLEGNYVAERFDWKKTIGPLEQRPGHQGPWGYRSSDGLGLLEFLGWCDDLHMQPLLAVYAGYSLAQDVVRPGPALQPFVQDALDEIEYCTGDATTRWGKQRAADGHPKPFDIRSIEIGNEDNYDKSKTYDGRFAQFYDAIKKAYPSLQCIATTKVTSRTPDLYDDHDYPSPKGMLAGAHRYDHRDPKLPKVFFGEWAAQQGKPTPTLRAALADAAWLTGLQRDAETVLMNCYAPLLVNVNPGAAQWPTNLIGYDATDSFGSPSYWSQVMFAANWGDAVLPVTVAAQDVPAEPAKQPYGSVGIATCRTTAEFKDISVTHDGQALQASDFSKAITGWSNGGGTWVTDDGVARQTDADSWGARIFTGKESWHDYTLRTKVRKLSGEQGFILAFHVHSPESFVSLNVGGWDNVTARFEKVTNNGNDTLGEPVPFTVKTGQWYDVRVECRGNDLQAFVDDKLLLHARDVPAKITEPVFAVASKTADGVILKVVNTAHTPQSLDVSLSGVGAMESEAALTTLQGGPDDVNSIASPEKVVPKETMLHDAGTTFNHVFPAYSVSVIRLRGK